MNNLNNKQIIFFDGSCTLCNNYILFLAKRDRKNHFLFSSLQSKIADELIKIYDREESVILLVDNIIKTKSDAVIYILSKLNFPYNIAPILYIIPKYFRDILYTFIAKRRKIIFPAIEDCGIVNLQKNQTIMEGKIL